MDTLIHTYLWNLLWWIVKVSIQRSPCLIYSFIYQHNPNIVVGSQSWLTDSICNSEIFSDTYRVYRHDQLDGYGRVFLVCKSKFVSEEITLSTSCDICSIACCIHLGHQSLILISIYRPPDRDHGYLEELCLILKTVVSANPENIVWLAGDVNFQI